MDQLGKLTRELQPLGGEMLLDRFLSALEEALVKPSPRAMTRPEPPKEARAPVPRAAERVIPSRPQASTGDEMDDYMNRDAIEGTSDEEVQEFLKDRSGFDPTEVE